MNGEAAYDVIRTRRVTRSMSNEPVDPRQLELVLRSARWAPSAGNRRLHPVLPVTDADLLRMLRTVSPGMIVRPQAAAVISVDVERAASFGFRPDVPGLFIDVGTVAATMLLAAHAVDLASCPVTSFSRAAVSRVLGMPSGVVPMMIICLGHPASTQPSVMSRLG